MILFPYFNTNTTNSFPLYKQQLSPFLPSLSIRTILSVQKEEKLVLFSTIVSNRTNSLFLFRCFLVLIREECLIRTNSYLLRSYFRSQRGCYYIMPIPPGAPAGIGGSGSLICVMPASVVRSIPATDPAFWSADLVTFTGSTIPALIMSSYSSFAALKPIDRKSVV